MTSLPPQLPPGRRELPNAVNAYNKCLNFEISLQEDIDGGKNVGRDMVYIRILGYLLHHVPTDAGAKTVISEIISCTTDSALLKVGEMYFNHYIRAFRANKGPVPTPSNHASRPSFDMIADMISDILEEAPQSHVTAKKKALYRDGFRCVVTGKYDFTSYLQTQELKEKVDTDRERMGPTQCAHIFAESTNCSIELGSAKRDYAASMWAVLMRFGHDKLPDELNGSNIHRLENVMTVESQFHILFDQLSIWFVPTQEENKYTLDSPYPSLLLDYLPYITFTTPDPVNFPVPSPTYLGIHAACAKVAHLSGAGQCIDKFLRDLEDGTTLDPDGGSADVLEHVLYGLQANEVSA